MSSIKVSVIGCGHWGKNLVRNYAEIDALFSVSDLDADLAKKASDTYGVPHLSFEEVLKSDVTGVVIAAPAAQHYRLAKQALEAGKHVFVEKPIALDIGQAEELCSLAQTLNQTLMVGHILQYHSAFITLKKLIKEGALGKIRYVYSNRLNLGKFRDEENILWSFAPHDISMILGLANELPESVYATGLCHLNPNIHDVTTTHLEFKSGLKGHIFVSWLHPFKEQKLIVVGDNGMAVFDDSQDWDKKLCTYSHQIKWLNGLPYPEKADPKSVPLEVSEPLRNECEHFLAAIRSKKTPVTDGFEGVRVLKVLQAAQDSLQSGQKKKLKNKLGDGKFFVHDTAIVDETASIGKGAKIWQFSHVMGKAHVGEDCIIGQNVMIGPDVQIGKKCKVQNNVSIYKGVTLEEGVFCGPSCVFTNVHNPRAEVERKDEFRKTHVERGVTIGANATIVCGNTLGAYSLIGAGAVVTKDVKPHAVMAGNPAKQMGWVSHAGEILKDDLKCPREHRLYKVDGKGFLIEIANSQIKKKS